LVYYLLIFFLFADQPLVVVELVPARGALVGKLLHVERHATYNANLGGPAIAHNAALLVSPGYASTRPTGDDRTSQVHVPVDDAFGKAHLTMYTGWMRPLLASTFLRIARQRRKCVERMYASPSEKALCETGGGPIVATDSSAQSIKCD